VTLCVKHSAWRANGLAAAGGGARATAVRVDEGHAYMTQPLVELYRDCMVVLKVPWCGITAVRVDEVRQRELVVVHPGRGHLGL
jgi:hypothetical protein